MNVPVSGIVIEDAPRYTLYRDTEQYIRRSVLPVTHTCTTCLASLTIDLPGDIDCNHNHYEEEYHRRIREYNEHKAMYPTPDPANYGHPWPNADYYRRPQLLITCSVCQSRQEITDAIRSKVDDLNPVLSYFRNTTEARYSTLHPIRSRITVERGVIAALVLVLVVLIIW